MVMVPVPVSLFRLGACATTLDTMFADSNIAAAITSAGNETNEQW